MTSFRLETNEVSNGELSSIAPELRKMSNLTELDLSCGRTCLPVQIELDEADRDGGVLADILEHLPNLERLDLSNHRLGGGLKLVLDPLKHTKNLRLKHLVCQCRFRKGNYIEFVD